jgi:hypothetical protein
MNTNNISKDMIDGLLCIPVDATHDEPVFKRNKNKRRSLFNYNKFMCGDGYQLDDSRQEDELAVESTDSSVSRGESSTSVTTIGQSESGKMSVKQFLKPVNSLVIDYAKKEAVKKLLFEKQCFNNGFNPSGFNLNNSFNLNNGYCFQPFNNMCYFGNYVPNTQMFKN